MTQRSLDPMLLTLAADLHRSFHETALLVSATNFPYAAGQLFLGAVGDAVGKARLILWCVAGLALALTACAFATDYTTLMIARAATGAFAGGIFPVALALVGDRTALSERQIAISRLLMIALVGQILGAAMAGLLVDLVGWRVVFAINAATAAIGFLAASYSLRGIQENRRRLTLSGMIGGYRAVLANPVAKLVLLTTMGEGAVAFGLFPFIGPLLIERGIGGAFEAGVIIGAFSIGGILYTLNVRRLITHLGQRRMLIGGGIVVGLAYAVTALPLPWQGLALLYFFAGFGFFMMHNTLHTVATELAPGARGAALALFAGLLLFGAAVGPAVGGWLSDYTGYTALLIGGGLIYTAIALNVARVLTREKRLIG